MRIVVIGGGLAGGAAACLLAQGGAEVLLLEREAAPADKICGEFVSIEAQRTLARLGLDLARLGARPIGRMRLARGGAVAETALPFQGVGLSRRVLDAALLYHAAACGATIRRGVTAQIEASPGGLLVRAQGETLPPSDAVLLASGKHDIHGQRRRTVRPPEDLVGFKTYFRLAPAQDRALQGHVEVTLFRDSYVGLQQVEGGRANLCLLAPRARLHRAGGDFAGLLADLLGEAPLLADRLDGATPLLDRPLSIFRVPYGFVHQPAPDDPAGLFRLGDQAGVIASFTGDGMSIALHSATLAAGHLLGGQDAAAYHHALRADIAPPIRVAAALYAVGRTRPGQALLMAAARMFPAALRGAAVLTRVRDATGQMTVRA
jgi:flavin-dependent dehydrogenase